jgi:sulfur carrier protein ThiS
MVKLIYRDKEYLLAAGMTLRDALKKIGVSPEAVLAVLNGQLVTDDTILQADTTLKLVAVISGGAGGARGTRRAREAGSASGEPA